MREKWCDHWVETLHGVDAQFRAPLPLPPVGELCSRCNSRKRLRLLVCPTSTHTAFARPWPFSAAKSASRRSSTRLGPKTWVLTMGLFVPDGRERAPLLASQEKNEWPREDLTNPFAQPERTGIVRVHQKKPRSARCQGRSQPPHHRSRSSCSSDLLPPSPPAEQASDSPAPAKR
jgi:hypothetical protein